MYRSISLTITIKGLVSILDRTNGYWLVCAGVFRPNFQQANGFTCTPPFKSHFTEKTPSFWYRGCGFLVAETLKTNCQRLPPCLRVTSWSLWATQTIKQKHVNSLWFISCSISFRMSLVQIQNAQEVSCFLRGGRAEHVRKYVQGSKHFNLDIQDHLRKWPFATSLVYSDYTIDLQSHNHL